MWLLRALAVILLIAIGAGLLAYVATGQRRFLKLSWRLFRAGLIFALIFFAMLIVERVVLVPF